MIILVLCLAFAAIVLTVVMHCLRSAPLDTELWGPGAALIDVDPETRVAILERHPELRPGLPGPNPPETGKCTKK